jgi:hypothetical protein
MRTVSRRHLLHTTALGAVACSLVAAPLPAIAEPTTPPEHLPPVPGMRGDRRANELWYHYMRTFSLHPAQETLDAYAAIGAALGGDYKDLYPVYRATREKGTYPEKFLSRVRPVKDEFALLSQLQLELIASFCRNRDELTNTFYWFGEGTLYDPRMPVGHRVHTVDYGPHGEPPTGWHIWHAFNRAMTLLGIKPDRWNLIDRVTGLGWATQSVAQPDGDAPNPPLPPQRKASLIRAWSNRTPAEMDVAFDSFPHPRGMTR